MGARSGVPQLHHFQRARDRSVEPAVACHTGRHSCFFQRYADGAWHAVDPVLKDPERIYR